MFQDNKKREYIYCCIESIGFWIFFIQSKILLFQLNSDELSDDIYLLLDVYYNLNIYYQSHLKNTDLQYIIITIHENGLNISYDKLLEQPKRKLN